MRYDEPGRPTLDYAPRTPWDDEVMAEARTDAVAIRDAIGLSS